jgi:hypothetical protein
MSPEASPGGTTKVPVDTLSASPTRAATDPSDLYYVVRGTPVILCAVKDGAIVINPEIATNKADLTLRDCIKPLLFCAGCNS